MRDIIRNGCMHTCGGHGEEQQGGRVEGLLCHEESLRV